MGSMDYIETSMAKGRSAQRAAKPKVKSTFRKELKAERTASEMDSLSLIGLLVVRHKFFLMTTLWLATVTLWMLKDFHISNLF